MTHVRFDSEAMLHQMAAQPITSASRFVTVLDQEHRPLIFCAGNDKKFYALQATATGTFSAVNLSAKLDISGEVQAIAVSQHVSSGKLYIAVATGDSDGESTIRILEPIAPNLVDISDDNLRRVTLFNNDQPQNVLITDLHINPAIENDWPLLVAVWRPATGGAKDDAKIARILVHPNRWQWNTELNIPQTVKDIRDVATVRTAAGEAIACLYQYNNVKSIVVVSTSLGDKWATEIDLPDDSDPRSLASVLDDDNLSSLLVSGGGLFRFTSDEVYISESVATRISSDPLYNTASRLTVAQTGKHYALWFRTDDHILGYQRGLSDNLSDVPVPLRPAGSSADFAPLLDPASKSQSLIVLGETNDLALMTQSADTTMWKEVPIMVQNLGKVMDVQAFVSHIEVKDLDGFPIVNETYTLSCSGWTRALINGRERVLEQRPTEVTTNERGIITIVVPTADISSYVYTVNNALSTKTENRLSNPHIIDPSGKVQERIGKALSGDKSLKDIDTPEGNLLEGTTASADDIRSAEEALKKLGTVLGEAKSSSNINYLANVSPISTLSTSTEVKSVAWEFWEWVNAKVGSIANYIVEKIRGAWHFIVHIAGEVWAFVLDTATAAIKAVSFVLQKIGVAFKKIWAWISYIFNIQDIKDVANSLRTMFTSSLQYAQDFVLQKRDAVDVWANELEQKLLDALQIKLPPELAAKKRSPNDAFTDDAANKTESVSAPANVSFNQLEAGKQMAKLADVASRPIIAVYDDVVEPILQELKQDVAALGTLIHQLFYRAKGVSVDELIKQIAGTFVHALAQSLKKLVTGFMKLGADLVGMLHDLINTPFTDFPVIGPILKLFGFKATILDIIVYVLAVPVTVFSKLITGRTPRRITAFDYKALTEGGFKDDNVRLAYSELGSYLGITEAFFESLYKTFRIASAEIPEPETFSAFGLTVELIFSAISFPWDRESPAWEFRLAIWSANLVNQIVHSICVKVKASPKLTAVIDAAVAVVAFALTQVVHHHQLGSKLSEWKDRDEGLIGLSIESSVFELVQTVSGTVGILAVDPVTKVGAAVVVAGCGATRAIVKTGTSVREHKLKRFDA